MTHYWYAVILWARFRCRVLGRHQDSVTSHPGYVVAWCRRCHRADIRVAP